jgi:lipoate-protein ligase B
MAEGLQIDWVGRVPYSEALARQLAAVEERRAGRSGDRLLLLEHPPVITLGRSARAEHLRTPRAELAARGVEVHEVARGGDVTWHGPGQLVGYLIVDLAARGLKDAHAFLRAIEGALAEVLGALGVAAGGLPGMTGVFVAGSAPPRKIASIGVGLRGWVSYHGFALNVTADAAAFSDVVPCGLRGVVMTSLASELAAPPTDLWDAARAAVARAFAARFA